ncbi:hypothetical protein [Pantoea agglomerans]|uniref:hypothetical protein n=1 Tax=Enterobacter agglomerans TaxID=549 RepID=UPI003BA93F86
MMATIVIFMPDDAQPSQTNADNLTLMIYPNLSEILPEPFERAEALAMFVVVTQVDNPVVLWLQANDPHRDAALVAEDSVELSHLVAFIRWLASPTAQLTKLWLTSSLTPGTLSTYRSGSLLKRPPAEGRQRNCGNPDFLVKLITRLVLHTR